MQMIPAGKGRIGFFFSNEVSVDHFPGQFLCPGGAGNTEGRHSMFLWVWVFFYFVLLYFLPTGLCLFCSFGFMFFFERERESF